MKTTESNKFTSGFFACVVVAVLLLAGYVTGYWAYSGYQKEAARLTMEIREASIIAHREGYVDAFNSLNQQRDAAIKNAAALAPFYPR